MNDESTDPVPGGDSSDARSDVVDEQKLDQASPDSSDEARRNFFWQLIAATTGAIVGIGPMVIGLFAFLVTPFRKKQTPLNFAVGSGGESNEYFVAPLEGVQADGIPRRFEIIADRVDAWNFIPGQAIGAIFLIRQETGSEQPEVVAFHATCPHAGCTVSFNGDTDAFLCPCHNSSFSKDGQKLALEGRNNPSPRALDKLTVNQQKLVSDGEVWVEFVNFYTGRKEQKPKI